MLHLAGGFIRREPDTHDLDKLLLNFGENLTFATEFQEQTRCWTKLHEVRDGWIKHDCCLPFRYGTDVQIGALLEKVALGEHEGQLLCSKLRRTDRPHPNRR